MITHHCHECGVQVDEVCADHPNALIDSISTPVTVAMLYTEYETLPEYVQLVQGMPKREPTDPPRWSGANPPPAIGTTVTVKMNSIGKATVVRYFAEHGYLGLLVLPLDPPAWYIKQNGRRATCHVFGIELGA